MGPRRKRAMMMTGCDRRKGDRRGRQKSRAGIVAVFRETGASVPTSGAANI